MQLSKAMDIMKDIGKNRDGHQLISLTERLMEADKMRAKMSSMKGKESSQTTTEVRSTQDAALQAQLTALIEATPDGIALVDPQGGLRYLNPAGRSMLEIGQDEVLAGLNLIDFCSAESRPHIQHDALPTTIHKGIWSNEATLATRAGRKVTVALTFFAHKETNAQVVLLSLILRDITAQKRREADLARLAHHDALTGLFNRRRFQEELERTLAQVRRYGGQGALLFIDVDGLKPINDTLGHQAGDAFLRNLATLLQERLREVDVVARLGGDEFAILLFPSDMQQTVVVAERLRQAVRAHTTMVADYPLRCTISLGIALFPQHGSTMEELIDNADRALYRAKAEGRNQHRMFTPRMKL